VPLDLPTLHIRNYDKRLITLSMLSREFTAFDPIRQGNGTFKLAGRVQHTNLTRPEARVGFRIADCLIFLLEHAQRPGASTTFQAPAVRSGSMTVICSQ
jgi:hypothetical protein